MSEIQKVEYGRIEIPFKLNFKNRKTLAIHVYPDQSVVVDAPENTSVDKIKRKVIKRAQWIKKQQRHFNRFPPALPARKYISGEAFRFLGEQYTLMVERNIKNEVYLSKGRMHVHVTYMKNSHIKKLLDTWFVDQARSCFEARMINCLKLAKRKADIEHDGKFKLRAMNKRWGSCSKNNVITLNPELIAAPIDCIDYVILHELCHVAEHNHSMKFYRLLNRVLPDWEIIKDRLETTIEHRDL